MIGRMNTPFAEHQICNRELMLYAIMNTLTDEKQLVLRDMLDILCSRIKLNSGIFSNEQFIVIVERMLFLFTKKDSGLSRRIIFYFFGLTTKDNEVENKSMVDFFENYSRNILTKGLDELYQYYKNDNLPIILSIYEELLSKQNIGELMVNYIINNILKVLKESRENDKRKDISLISEFLKNLNLEILFKYLF